jgi:cysteine-rich repeat protein
MILRPLAIPAAGFALLIGIVAGAVATAGAQTPECGNGQLEAGEVCDDGNLNDDDCCSSTCTPLSSGNTCDDGQACTVGDACRRGACVGIPTDPLCGLPVDTLACYGAAPLRGAAASFAARPGELVRDEFSAEAAAAPSLDLLKPGRICLPAGIDGAAPPAAAAFEGYTARADKGSRPFAKRGATADDPLGRAELVMSRAKRILVGSGVGFSDDETPAAATDRRYTCYQAAVAGRPAKRQLTISDGHGGLREVIVGRAQTLCVPEIAQPESAHGGYLTCYRARPTDTRVAAQTAYTANRYGSETLRIGPLREVCLPAALAPEVPDQPPFPFLARTDAASAALKGLYELADEVPRTAEAAEAARVARKNFREAVDANLPSARAELVAAMANLADDDEENYTRLVSLIEIAGDTPEILDHLRDLLLRPSSGTEVHQGIPRDDSVRQIAVTLLVHHARQGSSAARDRLFDSLASPHPGVQAVAISALYALHPDRRLIQRQMRQILAPESEYLLYTE